MEALTPEILNQIFDNIAAMERSEAGPRTTLVLARTARIFQQTALNIVWRVLPSIAPLLHTLPSDLWTTQERPWEFGFPQGQELFFTRPLEAADLVRFRHYSRRVRRIAFPNECSHISSTIRGLSIAPAVYHALASTPGLRPYLPSLECLQIRAQPEIIPHLPAVFFRDGLVNVNIEYLDTTRTEEDESSFSNMLHQLVRVCPRLRDLELRLFTDYTATVEAVSSALHGFRHLVNFIGRDIPIQIEAFKHLGGLPALTRLHAVIVFDQDALTPLLGDSTSVWFPALQKLHLSAGELSLITAILPVMRSTGISWIELHSENQDTPNSSLRDLFTTLVNHPSSARIEHITLDSGVAPRDRPWLDEATFEPLLALRNLTYLVVDVRSKALFCDYFLYRMARAWPLMQVLGIGTQYPCNVDFQPRATLWGLGIFAVCCPNLEALGMEVDACNTAYPLSGSIMFAQKTLRTLEVGYSKIQDEAAVAAFLSCTFPMLDEVDMAWEHVDDDVAEVDGQYAQMWETVEELIPEFVKVQQQERNWAAEHGWGVVDDSELDEAEYVPSMEMLEEACLANCRSTLGDPQDS